MSQWIRNQRQRWIESPENPKNWGIKEWEQNLWHGRIIVALMFGFLLGSGFLNAIFWILMLFLVPIFALFDWDECRELERKREEMTPDE